MSDEGHASQFSLENSVRPGKKDYFLELSRDKQTAKDQCIGEECILDPYDACAKVYQIAEKNGNYVAALCALSLFEEAHTFMVDAVADGTCDEHDKFIRDMASDWVQLGTCA